MNRKAVIVSGYFNPIHKGHLEYFNNAKAMADELFVIVNNNHQRALKRSKEFQVEKKRMIILPNWEIVGAAMKTNVVFEGRNLYRREILGEAGFDYFEIGMGENIA